MSSKVVNPYLRSHEFKSSFPPWELSPQSLSISFTFKWCYVRDNVLLFHHYFCTCIDIVHITGPFNWGKYNVVAQLCEKSHGHNSGFNYISHFCVRILNLMTWSSGMIMWSLWCLKWPRIYVIHVSWTLIALNFLLTRLTPKVASKTLNQSNELGGINQHKLSHNRFVRNHLTWMAWILGHLMCFPMKTLYSLIGDFWKSQNKIRP